MKHTHIATWNNTAIVVPAYRAAHHLPALFARVEQVCGLERMYVVDDGSGDDTPDVCRSHGVRLVRHEENQGKGAALRTGLRQAHADGWQWAVTLDADLQHEPESMPRFLARQRATGASLVYGRRCFSRKVMPWPRIASNRLTSLMVSLTCRQRVHDSQCGYRLYRLEPLAELSFRTSRYQFESEVLFKLAKIGARFSFVPIRTVYGDEQSHIRHLRDIANFIGVLLDAWR